MRDYGKIRTRLWGDDKVIRLSDRGKLLFLYLQTCSHGNGIGCFRLPNGYIESDLGWVTRTVTDTLSELLRERLIERCELTGWTFICNFMKHNSIDNPNAAKAMVPFIEAVPTNLQFYQTLIEALEPYAKRFEDGYLNRMANRMPNGMPNREPNLTQPEPNSNPAQQEQDAQARATPSEEITQAVDDWNSLAEQTGLTTIRTMTSKRRTALQARLRNCGLEGWQAMLEKIRGSPFLTGKNDRGWKADFDWILSESNFVKTTEGKYDAPAKQPKREQTWASTGDALAAKYHAAAELEDGGQGHAIAGVEPGLRLAAPIRQDAGRA